MDSLKDVATEHKNEFGKAIHSTLSTINKQVCKSFQKFEEMQKIRLMIVRHIRQKCHNYLTTLHKRWRILLKRNLFKSSPQVILKNVSTLKFKILGKTPERKSGKLIEDLVNIPTAKKLFEEQKGLITPKKDVNYKRRDSFLDSSFVSSLVSPDTLKCNLQATNMTSTTKTGRLEPVDEEKKNECGTSLSFK